MEKRPTLSVSGDPFFVIFTDLDGTLLDHDTYSWKKALPARDLCKRLQVPVIPVSSKTRAEIDLLYLNLQMSPPFISENGGGIFFQEEALKELPPEVVFDNGLWKLSLGLPYTRIIRGLQEIRDELGWDIRGFSDMDVAEISRLTGLDTNTAHLASMREFDEPFIVLEDQPVDENTLLEAAAKRGLCLISGGRFYHLQGKNDKGQAVEKLISWYKQSHGQVISMALGDSPNDFSMLASVDYPFLVRSRQYFPELKTTISRLETTDEMGSEGWNSAVLTILGIKKEPDNV